MKRSSYEYQLRHFAGFLKAWLKTYGVTHQAIAAAAGISNSNITKIMAHQGISVEMRGRITQACKGFHVKDQ